MVVMYTGTYTEIILSETPYNCKLFFPVLLLVKLFFFVALIHKSESGI